MSNKLIQYSRPARRYEQAHQLWPILSGWASFPVTGRLKRPGIITYGEAAVQIGYDAQAGRTLSNALAIISKFCNENQIPHLNAIVVDYETGQPGGGIPIEDGLNFDEMQEKVLDFKWFNYRQPTLRTLKEL